MQTREKAAEKQAKSDYETSLSEFSPKKQSCSAKQAQSQFWAKTRFGQPFFIAELLIGEETCFFSLILIAQS